MLKVKKVRHFFMLITTFQIYQSEKIQLKKWQQVFYFIYCTLLVHFSPTKICANYKSAVSTVYLHTLLISADRGLYLCYLRIEWP